MTTCFTLCSLTFPIRISISPASLRYQHQAAELNVFSDVDEDVNCVRTILGVAFLGGGCIAHCRSNYITTLTTATCCICCHQPTRLHDDVCSPNIVVIIIIIMRPASAAGAAGLHSASDACILSPTSPPSAAAAASIGRSVPLINMAHTHIPALCHNQHCVDTCLSRSSFSVTTSKLLQQVLKKI